jgi:hypothetical protein
MYFTHWINLHLAQPDQLSLRINETHARWIFALLSRVDDYISADDTSLLRNLARASLALLRESTLRRHNAKETLIGGSQATEQDDHCMSERSCWIIITAVAGVWGQRDLWIDADSMLAGLPI